MKTLSILLRQWMKHPNITASDPYRLCIVQGARGDPLSTLVRFQHAQQACGSGRTLVSHYMEKLRRDDHTPAYYIGEDIDIASVKMCALNMLIHGMHGRSIRHDTLRDPISFDYGFEINEVRYPFPTPFYSLRRITYKETDQQRKARLSEVEKPTPRITPKQPTKPKELTETTIQSPKPDKNGQYSLF